MSSENCVDKDTCEAKHGGLDKLIKDIDGDIKTIGKEMVDLKKSINRSLERLYDKIELFAMRPSWWVLIIISSLSSMVVGLFVKMVF